MGPETQPDDSAPFRILSIDGGGIRGIIPAKVLTELEERGGTPIWRRFDMIAGTSTGGILACALLAPSSSEAREAKFTAKEALELYIENGDEIFQIPFFKKIKTLGGIVDEKYPASGIESVLDSYFKTLKLSDLLRPSLITSYDIANRQTRFFTSHDAFNPKRDFLLRDIARATSAAPTYFEVAQIYTVPDGRIPYPLIDGGIFANNPAMCAYAEAISAYNDTKAPNRNLFAKVKNGIQVLSLGTGEKSEKGYSYHEAKDWGPAKWMLPVLSIMSSASAEVAHYQLSQILRPNEDYFRIQVPLQQADRDMDNATQPNIIALEADAETWISRNGELLDKIGEVFV